MAPSTTTSNSSLGSSPTHSPTVAPGEPTNGAFAPEPDTVSSPHSAAIVAAIAVVGIILFVAVFAFCWYMYMGRFRSPPNSRGSGRSAARMRTHPAPPQQDAGLSRSDSTNWARHDYRNSDAVELDGGIELQTWGARQSPRTQNSATDAEPVSSTPDTIPQTATDSAQHQQQQQHDTPLAVRNLERTLQDYPSRYLACSLPTLSSPSTMPGPITPAATRNPSPTQYAVSMPQRPEAVYTPSVYRPSLNRNPFTVTRQPSLPTVADGPENPFTATAEQQPTNPFTDAAISAQQASRSAVSLGSTASLYRRIDSNINLYHALTTNNAATHPQPFNSAAITNNARTTNARTTNARTTNARTTNATTTHANAVPQQQQEVVYRGLSTRSTEPAPWDFLSAEDAVGGGWRNSVGGVSGWETVGEEDEGEGEEK